MKTTLIYFSPCGTTAKLAQAVAGGTGLREIQGVDLTDPKNRAISYECASSELAIFAFPVYFGRIPTVCADFLKRLKADGSPAVLILNSGNEPRSDALCELFSAVKAVGFRVVAAAEFISRHVLAPGLCPERPSKSDLAAAVHFGQAVATKLESNPTNITLPPFAGGNPAFIPSYHLALSDACDGCGKCAAACPVGAVNPNDPTEIDELRCISCGRCVAECEAKARTFAGNYAADAELRALKNPQMRDVAIYI